MKEILKNYFTELVKTDNAIKSVYEESKLDECIQYIRKQAQKQAKNGFCAVEDAVVYKWARDFMLGDIPEEEKSEVPESETKTESPDVQEEPQTEEMEIVKEEKVVIKAKKEKPKSDDEAQLLFDF